MKKNAIDRKTIRKFDEKEAARTCEGRLDVGETSAARLGLLVDGAGRQRASKARVDGVDEKETVCAVRG